MFGFIVLDADSSVIKIIKVIPLYRLCMPLPLFM